MIEHIGPDLADYVEGRLPPDRAREVEEHLRECADCAADVAWVHELNEEAFAHGMKHIAEDRLVALAASEADALTAVERAHLESCESCSAELKWARGVPSAERMIADLDRAERPKTVETRAWWWPLALWGTPVAAAAALALFLVMPRDSGPDLASLARIEPLSVNVTRGAEPADSFEEARLLGLEAYAAGDLAEAGRHLGSAAGQRPDDAEIVLYLGSIAMLLGEWPQAIGHLDHAVDAADGPRFQEEASWQLANAHLAAGNQDEAVAALEEVVRLGLRRRAEAEELLGQLASPMRTNADQ